MLHFRKSVLSELIRCTMRSSYLGERDQESAEVTGGVADDGVLQALPVLWKEGICLLVCLFFRKMH